MYTAGIFITHCSAVVVVGAGGPFHHHLAQHHLLLPYPLLASVVLPAEPASAFLSVFIWPLALGRQNVAESLAGGMTACHAGCFLGINSQLDNRRVRVVASLLSGLVDDHDGAAIIVSVVVVRLDTLPLRVVGALGGLVHGLGARLLKIDHLVRGEHLYFATWSCCPLLVLLLLRGDTARPPLLLTV